MYGFEAFLKQAFRLRAAPQAGSLEPGLYHYRRELGDQALRYHLRVEADGAGLLLCNAKAACRLSPTGVVAAAGLLEGRSEAEVLARLEAGFRIPPGAALPADVAAVKQALDDLATPHGRYPIQDLDHDAALHRRSLASPLSTDLVAGEGARGWLRPVWDAGVPQVVVAASDGEPDHVIDLVEHAEDLGLIAGVRARGAWLAAGDTMAALIAAGLDHVDVLYAGEAAHGRLLGEEDQVAARKAIQDAAKAEICAVAVVPFVAPLLGTFESVARELVGLGAQALVVWAVAGVSPSAEEAAAGVLPREALRQVAAMASEVADALDLNLIWAPPVERRPGLPLADQVAAGPFVGAEGSLRIEADGRVFAPCGPREPVGRLDRDNLAAIWQHPRLLRYRAGADELDRCPACPRLALCAAGCPADPASWVRGAGGEP